MRGRSHHDAIGYPHNCLHGAMDDSNTSQVSTLIDEDKGDEEI
ncbi:uncharacterized protein G2W53_016232 [Senna tora]|uniref:Uncharacterized protein n=1 Tax=Senna tora TaxID=362788 RepID=A0A834TMK0_9FABA|nr:uncharacterized protein G2W53_016232 [Senna tora]